MGDLIGYRRVYCGGLVVFTLASLACSLSSTLTELTLARALQASGAAGIWSVNLAIVRTIYPARLLGRGTGLSTACAGFALAMGPTMAAAILSIGTWRWLFAINVPIGVFAYFLSLRSIPRADPRPFAYDWPSAFLNVVTFGLAILSLNGLAHHLDVDFVSASLIVALACGFMLLRRQHASKTPLLPIDLLGIRVFSFSLASALGAFTATMMALVSLPFFLQDVLGCTASRTGLLIAPFPAAMFAMSPIAGRLSDRYSPNALCATGLAIVGIGMFSLRQLDVGASGLEIIAWLALSGLGFGLFQSTNNRILLSSAPRGRSGGVSGIFGTTRLLGQSIGAALVALMYTHFTSPTSGVLMVASVVAVLSSITSVLGILQPRRIA
jgi:DHA2 family multidrug resistance protein-like MFS transporter